MFFRDSLSPQDACQIKGLQTFLLDAVGDTSQHENETQSGDTLADFLHKKKDSSLWYYRRRYPKDVAQKLGAAVFMKSLKTSVKRDAAKLSRQLSVEFDTVCHDALLRRDAVQAFSEASVGDAAQELRNDAATVLSEVPQLIRLAAVRVIEEQQSNPTGWQDVVKKWQSFYEAMKAGAVPIGTQRPALVAQAFLNGIQLVVEGKPLPMEQAHLPGTTDPVPESSGKSQESWSALRTRALKAYREKVGAERYQLAESKLPEIVVVSTSEHHVHEALKSWCKARLKVVLPRTVSGQLDCMVSALRCAMPKLQKPVLKELKGVMQPRTGDRQSMPMQAIRDAMAGLKARPPSKKVRASYDGGASQFDPIAIEVLAVLGMRPRELIQAKTDAIYTKTDVFGNQGLYFRIVNGKNKASEREIPLSDGSREVVDISRLRKMLEWQERNTRIPHGAVSSLNTRFREITGTHTLYQMRHSWKDVAVHANVDFELRERLLGHSVSGVAAVYGSGIPLKQGLDALMNIRSAIHGRE